MEIQEALDELNLTHRQFSTYININERTVRRWAVATCFTNSKQKAPKYIYHLLKAWIKLNRIAMPWRPGEVDVMCMDYGVLKKIVTAITDRKAS